MEEDLTRSTFSSDPEPSLLGDFGVELTRSSSDSSSSTVDNNASKDSSHHCAATSLLDQSTRWTDLQHSLYLNSLEASFVNELHQSMRLRGWSLENNTDEAYKPRTLQNSLKMPSQSLSPQHGFQKKINIERIAPKIESTSDSHVLAGSQLGITSVERGCSSQEPNTYDYGLLCDEGCHDRGSSPFFDRLPRSLEKQCICLSFHQELIDSTTEVTDQNFKDEEAGSSCMPLTKKLKTSAADASSNDQVVPFGKFHTSDASTSADSTTKNKGHELLSELPESFHFPKSDLPYFLKGS